MGARPRRLIPARAGKTAGSPSPRRRSRAHPRACGENHDLRRGERRVVGSSPRVRGKPGAHIRTRHRPRLIPARAGKTSCCGVGCFPLTAHPRACGENTMATPSVAMATGSSPRVRGKPLPGSRLCGRAGLIPARAGKTGPRAPAAHGSRAHPRACGENSPWSRRRPSPRGSSPRVRGKPGGPGDGAGHLGLIPARAGKTSLPEPEFMPLVAHPRACGENHNRPGTGADAWGSSPRVRGKRDGRADDGDLPRLIPARAGKTWTSAPPRRRSPAHPRACGENGVRRVLHRDPPGSSPRVRGKRPVAHRERGGQRLIPARAGKTARASGPPPRPPAHPRACGENPVLSGTMPVNAGSSPRVRGKLFGAGDLAGYERLIPARAGKTTSSYP